MAVIVNDMSEVNIDADLVKKGGSHLSRTEEKLVEMSNGCICCTLREDLLMQVRLLAQEGKFDYLIIESTGISEPLPVATTFDFRDENGNSLADVSKIDTMVTVVDAANLIANYSSMDFLKDHGESLGEEDERTLVGLLVEQIEFADVIILNKIDMVSQEKLKIVKGIIRGLNAKAKMIETNFSKVVIDDVINTGLFDLEKAQDHPLWAQELNNFTDHVPETLEYGIDSFVYRACAPFDPQALHAFFNKECPGVIRSKGFFWLATRPEFVGEFSQAGALIRHEGIGRWLASEPQDQWPDGYTLTEAIKEGWDQFYGDRKQELVFIGLSAQMNEKKIRQDLDACLIIDYKNDPELYWGIKDPFPAWFPEDLEGSDSIDEQELVLSTA